MKLEDVGNGLFDKERKETKVSRQTPFDIREEISNGNSHVSRLVLFSRTSGFTLWKKEGAAAAARELDSNLSPASNCSHAWRVTRHARFSSSFPYVAFRP